MASNILSKFLPPALGSPSVYETLQQYDHSSDQSDLEERAGTALDEENLGAGFQDFELGDALTTTSHMNASTNKPKAKGRTHLVSKRVPLGKRQPSSSPRSFEPDELDDEVPQSLLIEDDEDVRQTANKRQHGTLPPPVPGPITSSARAKWQVTQEQQRLHHDSEPARVRHRGPDGRGQPANMVDPKEKAMWRWANVENLDNFLKDIYDYFIGNGIWCIILSRALNLL